MEHTMLTYSFENIGNDTLYEYLYKCIKTDILNQVLKPHDKLPSKRNFAKNLDVSTITVENAYAQLIAEGYLYSLPKKGYYVADISHPLAVTHTPEREAPIVLTVQESPYFASFLGSGTNHSNFPFSTWAKIMREIITSQSEALMTNPPPGGIMELRTAIADHLLAFRGMHVNPARIIVGAGTEYLYGLLVQLLGHDLTYAVEDPGYQKITRIYQSNGANCCYIPLDDNGIKIDALTESNADILHISPSHHYPTGIVTPISRRYELLSWASMAKNRYIIEDDYDCEFRLLGKPIPPLQSIDVMDKVIYINTFTKTLSSTVRISYMILPKPLLELFYKNLGFYSCTVSNFEQYTLANFIGKRYFEKHINRMRNFYKTQRDTLLACIETSELSSRIEIREADAGLHFLMKVDTKLTDEDIMQKAKDAGILVTCLSNYYHNSREGAEHTLVMNYSNIERDRIPEAVDRLCGVFCT